MAAEAEAVAAQRPNLDVARGRSVVRHLTLIDPARQIDVKVKRPGGLVDCYVPFGLIDNDEVAVDQPYVEALAKQFEQLSATEGGTGQHTPSQLGLIQGESVLRIMDGYHRAAGLRVRGEQQVYATAKLTDWDGLYDFRIFTAKDHPHVRYSRVVQWMRENWAHTGLPDLLSLEQAVLLYRFKGSGKKLKDHEGNPIQLAPDEIDYAKDWVARKENDQGWGIAAMTIHGYLKAAEHVDPALVHATRESQGSHTLEAPTQTIIKIFSNELPDHFDLQNLVMDTAREVRIPAHGGPRTLVGPEIRALCQYVAGARTLQEATRLIAKIDWKTWEPSYAKTKKSALRQAYDARNKGPAVLDKIASDITGILTRIDQSLKGDEEVTPAMRKKLREARKRALELAPQLGQVIIGISDLLGERAPLLAAVPDAVPAASNSRQETAARAEETDFEPDFDTSENEFEPDEEAVTVEPEEEEAEADTASTDQIWDDDVLDEDEEDEEEEQAEPKIHDSRLNEADGGETLASSKFKDKLRTYLNGKAEDFPDITNRTQIQWAENVLAKGPFTGPNYLADDLRDELKEIQKRISEKRGATPTRPSQNWRRISEEP